MRQFYGRALVVGGPLLLMLSLLGSIWQIGGLYGCERVRVCECA